MIKLSLITSSLLVKCEPCKSTINYLNALTFFGKFVKQGY